MVPLACCIILTAFGTSSNFGTLNIELQLGHVILLSAASAPSSQQLLQFGHWAIICIISFPAIKQQAEKNQDIQNQNNYMLRS